MIVAVDADCLCPSIAPPEYERYAASLVRALLAHAPAGGLKRVVVLTHPANHARFELLRDERCDVALLPRPLFEGRPVADWAALLSRHPRAGADLLALHQRQKRKVMAQTGAAVLHFPTDAREMMEIDAAVVMTLHAQSGAAAAVPLSATLADAVVVHSAEHKRRLTESCALAPGRVFLAPLPAATNNSISAAPNSPAALARALIEAYEHALASYELRQVA